MSRPLSWRTCPKCKSRATKIFSLETGLLNCQRCKHAYETPPAPKPKYWPRWAPWPIVERGNIKEIAEEASKQDAEIFKEIRDGK